MNGHLGVLFGLALDVVRFQVDLEVSLLGEHLLTNVAFERLYAQVLSQVDLKARLLRVRDWAEVAAVGLDVAVVHQVGLEVTLGDEGVVASWVHALVGTVVSV